MNNIKLGLERMHRVLKCLSNPHLKLPIVHVAGTNGKGSVCAFEAEILRTSGFRVGRFTSPYLFELSDSINLNGEDLDKETFEETKTYIHNLAIQNQIEISSFELLTATAFEIFSKSRYQLDLAVIEVGLGGATDATNVCNSSNTLFSCITPISFDHQAFLGYDIKQIAAQKAGITKNNAPLLLAQQSFPEVEEVVCKEAKKKSCQIYFTKTYPIPLHSSTQLAPIPIIPDLEKSSLSSNLKPHSSQAVPNVLSINAGFQHQNAVTAATLAHLLRTHPHPLHQLPVLSKKITDQSIVEGIRRTRWPGRMELVQYKSYQLLLDGAHNKASAKLLGDHLSSINRPITIIISLSSPRDPTEFVRALNFDQFKQRVQVIITQFSIPVEMQWVRPVSPEIIAIQCSHVIDKLRDHLTIKMTGNSSEALEHAVDIARGLDELIVVCGSLYLVSDILKIINHHKVIYSV